MTGPKRDRVRRSTPPFEGVSPQRTLTAMASLADFANRWLQTRSPRTQRGDLQRLRDHVLPILGAKRLRDLRSEDVVSAVRQIERKKAMSVKSAKNAFAVFYELLGAAIAQGLIDEGCQISAAELWPPDAAPPPQRFTAAEVAALTRDERLDADLRVWNTLAFCTGLSQSELCALRWKDWSEAEPAALGLGVPVPSLLRLTLQSWQQSGFEAVYGVPPRPEDWIVPRRSDPTQPHSEGSIYKAFRRCCVKLGIKTRSPHAVRNTFTAAGASEGATPDALESSPERRTI